MEQKQNEMFKLIVGRMYGYFFDDWEKNYDTMMEKLRTHTVEFKNVSKVNPQYSDFYNIVENIMSIIEEQKLEFNMEELKELTISFWEDLSPQYRYVINIDE